MSDTYSTFVNQGVGKTVATQLGLPRPARLRRYTSAQSLLEAPAAIGSVRPGPVLDAVRATLSAADAEVVEAAAESTYDAKLGAVVLDGTAVRTIDDLEVLRGLLTPAVKALGRSGRVVVIGAVPDQIDTAEGAAVQQSLEGIVRSIGKEMRAGGTANLLRLDDDAQRDPSVLAGPLRFFLSSRSAYVSGQPLVVRSADVPLATDPEQPFAGQTAVVTGAARGIGADIARVFARGGAHVIAVDIPAAGQPLADVANEIGGTALQLDITGSDAGARIAAAVARGADHLDVIVHNAGITRDKLFVNTDAERWASVLDVNLRAELAINATLLDSSTAGGLQDGGRIIGVASISGIGGNRGQANYAASKAGVIGAVRHEGEHLRSRGITVNAVAPGFIETAMTSKIPLATREVGRRLNSLLQGGLPVDVGEAIAFLAEPGSAGVTGQVLRVCGQSQLGA